MDIFGFQFSYSPTLLSGSGVFALFAMLVATGAFAAVYLVGVIVSIRIVGFRQRRRERDKKRRLKDLLAMKAAQDDLDVELEREMHGIRPTSNLTEFEILKEEVSRNTSIEEGESSQEEVWSSASVSVASPISDAIPIVSEESPTMEDTAKPSENAEETSLDMVSASEPVSETSPVSSPFGSPGADQPEEASAKISEPEKSESSADSSPEPVSPLFSFGFASEPESESKSLAVLEPEKSESSADSSPEPVSAPFGFSFVVEESEVPVDSEPAKAEKKTEPEPEMSSFFKAD